MHGNRTDSPDGRVGPTDAQAVVAHLRRLRRETGRGPEFWCDFAAAAARLCRSPAAVVVSRRTGDGAWAVTATFEESSSADPERAQLMSQAAAVADRAVASGLALEPLAGAGAGVMLAVKLAIETGSGAADRIEAAVVVLLARQGRAQWNEAGLRLLLIADIPAGAASGAAATAALSSPAPSGPMPAETPDVAALAAVLDLLVMLAGRTGFDLACLSLCNELATRFDCMRVSIGWTHGLRIKIQAVSHIERFDERSGGVQGLISVVEEALDQDATIQWPEAGPSGAVTAMHERFARRHGASQIVTLPFRVQNEPVGAVVCERTSRPFAEAELRLLHLVAVSAAPGFAALRRRDLPWPERLARWSDEFSAWLAAPRNIAIKLILALTLAGLLALFWVRWPYRVEAGAIVKTDHLAHVTAPFDGYIAEVLAEVGDEVGKGKPLLTLDTAELILKEVEATADFVHYQRAGDKARAQNSLADLLIAEAQARQAEARLDRIRYFLSQAVVNAPFDGIVVEGDRMEFLGAPVRKGDLLFKLARLEGCYLALDIDGRDIRHIHAGAEGEVTFLARPDLRFPVHIVRIDPVALVKPERGDVFVARAAFDGEPQPWWRPGMSGLARIAVETKPLAWILFHRAYDFVRLNFWW